MHNSAVVTLMLRLIGTKYYKLYKSKHFSI